MDCESYHKAESGMKGALRTVEIFDFFDSILSFEQEDASWLAANLCYGVPEWAVVSARQTMLGHITNISWVKAEIDKNFYSTPLIYILAGG